MEGCLGTKSVGPETKSIRDQVGKQGVFTPQFVFDGLADGVGAKEDEMMDIAARAMTAKERIDVGSLTPSICGDELRFASDKAEAEES